MWIVVYVGAQSPELIHTFTGDGVNFHFTKPRGNHRQNAHTWAHIGCDNGQKRAVNNQIIDFYLKISGTGPANSVLLPPPLCLLFSPHFLVLRFLLCHSTVLVLVSCLLLCFFFVVVGYHYFVRCWCRRHHRLRHHCRQCSSCDAPCYIVVTMCGSGLLLRYGSQWKDVL